jgi:hypothetical protein
MPALAEPATPASTERARTVARIVFISFSEIVWFQLLRAFVARVHLMWRTTPLRTDVFTQQ